MSDVLLPGSTVGILGGGQLGRMFAMAAARLGYRVHVLTDDPGGPAGQVAVKEVAVESFDDADAVAAFAREVDVVTYEFENVPAEAAATADRFAPVRPGPRLLHVARNRLREKQAFADLGIPVAPFRRVTSVDQLRAAVGSIGTPCILKTTESGYDGKGQVRIDASSDLDEAWATVAPSECVLEGFVEFEREVSIIAARGLDGSFANYEPIENVHVDGILDVSVCPGNVPDEVAASAAEIARTFAESLEIVGVFCIELFATSGGLVVNEVAPRPHNSGHLTIEAHHVSQFEQQLRAVCGLPLGSTTPRAPAAMANLVGDPWTTGQDGTRALTLPGVSVHLYGKGESRPGRKMGHVTATAASTAEARELALEARRRLQGG